MRCAGRGGRPPEPPPGGVDRAAGSAVASVIRATTRSAMPRKNSAPPPSSTPRIASWTGVIVISPGGGSSSTADSAGASTSQPSPPGSAPAPAQTTSPAGQLVQHRRGITLNPGREDQRLGGGGRDGGARELLDDAVDRLRAGDPAAPSRLPAAVRPASVSSGPLAGVVQCVLPGGEDAAKNHCRMKSTHSPGSAARVRPRSAARSACTADLTASCGYGHRSTRLRGSLHRFP